MNAAGSHVADVVAPGRLRLVRPTRWALWSCSRPVIWYVLTLDLLAALSTIGSLLIIPATRAHVEFAAVLVVGWLLYGELTRGIERIRPFPVGVPHVDLSSVWMFAAALLTHPAFVSLLVVAVFVHPWLRIHRDIVYRRATSAAATVLGLHAAMFLTLATTGPFAQAERTSVALVVVVVAGGLFMLTDTLLLSGAIALSTPNPRLRTVLAHPDEYALEAATVGLGILLAWALADWPIATLLVVGISFALHNNVLIRQFQEKARTDHKTGLLNAGAWRSRAEAELSRAAREHRTVGLLMLDIDHFKKINDDHGHLVADEILVTVAAAITAEVRDHDPVGRFGGDEFVILLPGSRPAATREIAERLRARIAGLAASAASAKIRISVSIGAASYPEAADSLDKLIQAADRALLLAKDRGRDQVRVVGSDAGSAGAEAGNSRGQ